MEAQRRIAYCPETGQLTWRSDPCRGREIGDPLSCRNNGNGYIYTRVNRQSFAVHRLAWAVTHGYWPIEIDHKNLDKSDNRLVNLREVTRTQNQMNAPKQRSNTSGYKGVSWHKDKGRWRAYIVVEKRHVSLGYHPTAAAAHAAYLEAARANFGQFARAE